MSEFFSVHRCFNAGNMPRYVLAAAATLALPALAQQRPGPPVLTAHALNGGVYWVAGGVSNAGFIVGDKGVIVIDAQVSPEAAQLALAAIAKVTPKPVDTVLVTHGDPDHVGGLPAYPAGANIIAQENIRSVILASAADASGGPVLGARYKALLPSLPARTISGTESVLIDGVRMVLMHIAPAHTSGDLIVYLPRQKIVFAGDVITTSLGPYPVIHDGGSSQGWIETMQAILALDARTYISGHGENISKAKLQAWLQGVIQRRAAIKTMVYLGKGLDEINLALPDAPVDPRFPTFNQTTYDELSKGYPPAHSPWSTLIKPAPVNK